MIGTTITGPAGTFYDVADCNERAGDIWNANNTSKTQGPGIPAGVCP